MRLIDADEAGKGFCKNCIEKAICKGRETVCTEKANFLDALDNVPTIDAVPVKHGHWILSDAYQTCSLCGVKDYGCIPPYCQNCGARMVGVAK